MLTRFIEGSRCETGKIFTTLYTSSFELTRGNLDKKGGSLPIPFGHAHHMATVRKASLLYINFTTSVRLLGGLR
jgi:hypothetical protein